MLILFDMNEKDTVFWDMRPCSLVHTYQCFARTPKVQARERQAT